VGSLPDPTNISEIKFDENGKEAMITVFCRVHENKINELRYESTASIPVNASLSYLAEHLTGKHLSEAFKLHSANVISALDLPPNYHYCAARALEAIQKALSQSDDPFDKAFRSLSAYNGPFEKNQPIGFED